MTASPGLQAEDRPDFERALHQALRTAEIREALGGSGSSGGTDIQRLRSQALVESEAIATAAAPEYAAYLRQRAAAATAASTSPDPSAAAVTVASAVRTAPFTTAGGRGLLPALAVLTPALAGASAAAFLLLGGLLRLSGSQRETADALLTAGLTSATIAAVTLAAGMVCLVVTAVRHRSSPPDRQPRPHRRPHAHPHPHPHPHTRTQPPTATRRDDAAVATARDAWLRALLHRGILPFLRDRLKMSHTLSRTSQKSEKGST
ncbi:hypothetical protein [Streptomyces milbemycinicus]|uniref:Uncharacterized protein n=1 Tax=Streptomyces milbemycinicus TaxID=476552 RepID=A0ABW8M696_9ACTN